MIQRSVIIPISRNHSLISIVILNRFVSSPLESQILSFIVSFIREDIMKIYPHSFAYHFMIYCIFTRVS